MALQVWLPLTQDLRQQGLNSTNIEEVTSAVFDNGGKLGKCLSGGKIKVPASKVASIFNNTSMSITFWYNNNTSETTGNHSICGFQGNIEGDTDAVRIWDFFNYSTPNDFHWSMGTLGSGFLNGALPANTWVHIAVTWQSPTLKVYINGELEYTGSGSSNYTFDKSYYISFGHTPQKLNDFRIYDNCLTSKEIKKIAQGLILHYPLSNNGWGNKNLIANSQLGGSYTYPSTGYSDIYLTTTTIVPSGDTYTLSFDAKSTVEGDVIETHYWSPNTTLTAITNQGFIGNRSDGWATFTLTTEWKRYWVVYTQSETTEVKHLICPRLNTISGRTGSGTISMRNVKFEEGNKPTSWHPDSFDSLNIEYDTSGYCYNGSKSEVVYDSDTPKNSVSTIFNANTSTISITPCFSSEQVVEAMTCSIWFKTNTLNSTAPNLVSLGENGFFRFRLATSTSIWYYIRVGSTQCGNTFACKNLTDNNWHHIVVAFDKGYVYVYIDGELIGTGNHSEIATYMTCYNVGSTWHLAGYMANSENFIGKESDFRIYTTALSAEDIRALYQARNIPD